MINMPVGHDRDAENEDIKEDKITGIENAHIYQVLKARSLYAGLVEDSKLGTKMRLAFLVIMLVTTLVPIAVIMCMHL